MADERTPTLGPWAAWYAGDDPDGDLLAIRGEDGRPVLTPTDFGDMIVSPADLRLILAAPDLFAACMAALAYDAAIQRHAVEGKPWVEDDDLDRLYDAWIEASRAAVAKAEGREAAE